MPYIPVKDRYKLHGLKRIANDIETTGELNYAITLLLIGFVKKHGRKYASINDVLGALDGAAREFYDRVGRPYEDIKIKQNGDVYEDLFSR